ncbi:hypothetical protein GCM10027299_30160 [Larkinella ripae]
MKSKQFSFLIALFLVVSLSSCMNNFNDESAGKAAQNDQQIKDYLNANQLQGQVTATASGLYHIISPAQVAATAKTPKAGEELEFTYTLSYIDANKAILVDSANKTKSAYIPFLPGVVIAGLEEGFTLMKEGQRGQFFIPSNIGFGGDDRGKKMPTYVPVIFDVKLIRSRSEAQQIEDYATIKKLGTPTLVNSEVAGDTNKIRVYPISKGTGPKVVSGQTVTVAYSGTTFRAPTPFDKSDSLTFKTGSGQYIAGFDRGVVSLNVGDKAWLVFPSAIGYGSQGSYDQNKQYYVVPPYTPLAFEVTVKSAK